MIKTYSKRPGNETGRPVRCNLCGGERLKAKYSIDGGVFCRCGDCGLVFQNPQPVSLDLQNRYDDDYFSYEIENEAAFYDLARLGLQDIGFDRFRPDARALGPFLDVGCATGYLLNEIHRTGWETEGVEICAASAEYASKRGGFPVHTLPLEALKFPSDQFGTVHLSHVIEHLNDPAGFCREVFRILAPGGFFIMTTPNIAGFQSRLLGSGWRSAIPDHLYLFSRKTLSRMVREAGFELQTLRTWGGLASGLAPLWLKRPFDRLVKRLSWGDVMILLLRKPPVN